MDCAASAQGLTLLRFISGDMEGVFNIFQVKRGCDGGNCGIKRRAFGQ